MHKETSSAKDFFLHLLSSITLYMSAIAFLMICYQLVGYLFPDASLSTWQGDYSSEILRTGIAMFLISFPVFIGTRFYLARMYDKDEKRKEFALRKWLIFLTMFVAALIVIISLISVLYTFLSGELTARFGLKAGSTMLVAVVMFSYYLLVIKNQLTKPRRLAYMWSTVLVSIALIVSTFVVIGSPAQARLVRLDAERVSDLSSLTYNIANYYTEHDQLPAEVADVTSLGLQYEDMFHDPMTKDAYEYEVTGEKTYTLCATFDTDTTNRDAPRDAGNGHDDEWYHDAGQYCFEREVPHVTDKPVMVR